MQELAKTLVTLLFFWVGEKVAETGETLGFCGLGTSRPAACGEIQPRRGLLRLFKAWNIFHEVISDVVVFIGSARNYMKRY